MQVEELPGPPPGRTGWPWTDRDDATPPDQPASLRVSIVTPTFNRARFLEETIRSVLLQNYPSVEYVIIDGGSTDDTLEVIEKYESWLTLWKSEPDNGPTEALAKGFSVTTGEVLAWINSDDILLPGAISSAASRLSSDATVDVVFSSRLRIDSSSEPIDLDIAPSRISRTIMRCGGWIPQETTFFRREMYEKIGGIDGGTRNLAPDYDLFLRMFLAGARFTKLEGFLGAFRAHDDSISVREGDAVWRDAMRSRDRMLGETWMDRVKNLVADRLLVHLLWRIRKIQWRLTR